MGNHTSPILGDHLHAFGDFFFVCFVKVTVKRINNPRCIALYYTTQMVTAPGWRRLGRCRDRKPGNRRVQLPPCRFESLGYDAKSKFLETVNCYFTKKLAGN